MAGDDTFYASVGITPKGVHTIRVRHSDALTTISNLRHALATATGMPLGVIEIQYPDPPMTLSFEKRSYDEGLCWAFLDEWLEVNENLPDSQWSPVFDLRSVQP